MAETKGKPGQASVKQDDADKMVQEALAQAKSSISELQAEADKANAPGSAPGGAPGSAPGGAGSPMSMPELGVGSGGAAQLNDIELLSDVDLQVSIELGRTQMVVEDVLRLAEGSVVELDKLAGDPVDVYVNQRLVARGEVLVVNDNFCIRISEIVANLEEQAEQAAQEHEDANGA